MGYYADHVFPWILDRMESPAMGRERERTLRDVGGEVLEIGLGTGANLPFYPPDVRTIFAVEPVTGMNVRAERRAAAAGRHVQLTAHNGARLPFENDRFDSVVITLVLCSVPDRLALLAEAARVLRPDGSYYFLEHVLSSSRRARSWQRRFNGVSKRIGCGCELIHEAAHTIGDSGFKIDAFEQLTLPGQLGALYPLIRGHARKPARG